MTKETIEEATVKIELTVTKLKNILILKKQLAEGNLPNGTHFKLCDSGSHFQVEHQLDEKTRIIYSFFKEELFRQLAESVLTKKPEFVKK